MPGSGGASSGGSGAASGSTGGTAGVGGTGGAGTGGSAGVAGWPSTGGTGGVPSAVCGDAVLDWWAESCDDGNQQAGDGCDGYCQVEPGWACQENSCRPVVCGYGFQDSTFILELAFFGTGGMSTGGTGGSAGGSSGSWIYEACDDGNTAAGDGCDESCQIEPGWTCEPSGCRPVVCGDGFQDSIFIPDPSQGGGGAAGAAGAGTGGSGGTGGGMGGIWVYEACDDGNTAAGAGCSAACDIEDGYWCDAPGQPCRQVLCGDGEQSSYAIGGEYFWETCDDGNAVAGDGCDAGCEVEAGFVCEVPGTPCRQPACGDGYWDTAWGTGGAGGSTGGSGGTLAFASGGAPSGGGAGGVAGGSGGMPGSGYYEGCDDGNTQPGDGCDASCEVEPGWVCDHYGCREPICGDGIADWPLEECDDGNDVAGDGCDACLYEGWPGTGGVGTGGALPTTGGVGGTGGS